jgi:acetyl-CoA acyltransferase 1
MVRAASLAAGIPNTAGASSVNRFCSSGLKAIQDVANQISLRQIDIGIAMGAESMTMSRSGPELFHEEILKNQESADCLQPMGQTSENVGDDFGITREIQDRYSVESFRRAEVAQKAGWFDDEIVPIITKIKDPKTGSEKTITLTKDEGPRYGTTYESLSEIHPAFPQFGNKTTAGNASQVTDGGRHVLFSDRIWITRLTKDHSRRRCPHASIQSHRTQPTHPGEILRRHRGRRTSSRHGHRPYRRHPQAAETV